MKVFIPLYVCFGLAASLMAQERLGEENDVKSKQFFAEAERSALYKIVETQLKDFDVSNPIVIEAHYPVWKIVCYGGSPEPDSDTCPEITYKISLTFGQIQTEEGNVPFRLFCIGRPGPQNSYWPVPSFRSIYGLESMRMIDTDRIHRQQKDNAILDIGLLREP